MWCRFVPDTWLRKTSSQVQLDLRIWCIDKRSTSSQLEKNLLWAFFLNSKMTTFCSQNQSRILRSLKRSLFISTAILNLTKMNLTVAGSPHGVGVVDTDVLPLLDVHCCPDHHSAQQNCHRHCGEINLAKIRALHLCIFFRFPLTSRCD